MHKTTRTQIENYIDYPVHGLGLFGLRGSGKKYLSNYIARRILPKEQSFALNTKIINSSDAGIDSVREIREFVRLRMPGEERIKRVVIVYDSENLSTQAQSALLKILEEPPNDTSIILTASDKNRILPTVLSRVISIEIRPISLELARSNFKEHKSIEVEKSWLISQGRVGLTIGLLESNIVHPLVLAINQAKEFIRMEPFLRISKIDKLVKNKDFDLFVLLEGFEKVIHSALEIAIKKNASKKEISSLRDKLSFVMKSQRYAENKVLPKLVLASLFLVL